LVGLSKCYQRFVSRVLVPPGLVRLLLGKILHIINAYNLVNLDMNKPQVVRWAKGGAALRSRAASGPMTGRGRGFPQRR
jgi:hypothetical protein